MTAGTRAGSTSETLLFRLRSTTLADLHDALLRAAGPDTAYPPLKHLWSPGTLSEHCGVVAYVVKQFFGWRIMSGKGKEDGVRWIFNQKPDGTNVCLATDEMPDVYKVRPGPPLEGPRSWRFLDRARRELIEEGCDPDVIII